MTKCQSQGLFPSLTDINRYLVVCFCELSGDCRRFRGTSPPLNNQRALTPPGAGRPRHPWLDSPIARRHPRQSHSWIDTTGSHQGRRRHTVSTSRARRRSDGRTSFGGPGGRHGDHRTSRGGRYQHNDLTGSGGSPDDWRSSPSNTDEHRDKMVHQLSRTVMLIVLKHSL